AFGAFATAHPKAGEVSAALLAAHPDDPRAMVARGWYLQALGQVKRGGASIRSVNPAALDEMQALHAEAMQLALAAVKAAPEMVAASDLVLVLSRTLGEGAIADAEFARIMQVQPTRQSLLIASLSLAPRWGGPPGWSDRACEVWAAKVVDVADYTAEVCALDMLYSAWGNRDDQALAWDRLALQDHPILDSGRLAHAQSGLAPTDEAIAVLQRIKEAGEMNLWDARKLDALLGQSSSTERLGPAEAAVLPQELARSRAEADFNPGSSLWLEFYMAVLYADMRENGTPWPADEIDRRYALVFQLAPYDFDTWMRYGQMQTDMLHLDDATLDEVEAVRAYFINGVVTGNHSAYALWGLEGFNRIVWSQLDKRNLDAMDATGAPAFDKADYDRAVVCPEVRAIRLMQAACDAEGGGSGCPKASDPTHPWDELLARAEKRKACGAELGADPYDLRYEMQVVPLPGEG
ncbi:MAG: hypothetical protein WAS26_03860, partial [Paracoccaceae bacterium]